jgi:hypothetical protein
MGWYKQLMTLSTTGGDLEHGESVIMETWAEFHRMKFKGVYIWSTEGRLLLTDRRLLFAPLDFVKVLSPVSSLVSLLGVPGAPILAIAGVAQYGNKAKSLPQITDVRPSGEGLITRLPKLSVTLATGDEYQFGVRALDVPLALAKANTKTRDALVEAIRRQIDRDSS